MPSLGLKTAWGHKEKLTRQSSPCRPWCLTSGKKASGYWNSVLYCSDIVHKITERSKNGTFSTEHFQTECCFLDRWNMKIGKRGGEKKDRREAEHQTMAEAVFPTLPLKQSITCVARMKEDPRLTQHIPCCIWQSVSPCEVLWFWILMLACVCVLCWGKCDTHTGGYLQRCCGSTPREYCIDISSSPLKRTHRLSLFTRSLLVWKAWCYRTSADDWMVTIYCTKCQGPLIL